MHKLPEVAACGWTVRDPFFGPEIAGLVLGAIAATTVPDPWRDLPGSLSCSQPRFPCMGVSRSPR